MNIRLHIEKLILEGLPLEAAHGPAVQAALEAELMRLVAQRGLAHSFRQSGAMAHVRGGDLSAAHGDTPGSLGEKIGRAVLGDTPT